MSVRRRSKRSTSAPSGIPSRRAGISRAANVKATARAESETSRVIQPTATKLTDQPTAPAAPLTHIAGKPGIRKAARVLPVVRNARERSTSRPRANRFPPWPVLGECSPAVNTLPEWPLPSCRC